MRFQFIIGRYYLTEWIVREDATAIYGLTIPEMENVWHGMGILTQRLTIWPDPRHLLAEGSKLYHMKIITEASSSLGFSYPRALQVNPALGLIREITGGTTDGVLKREFSSQGRHVYSIHTTDAENKLAQALRTEAAAYSGETTFPKPIWYLQPYVAPLIFLGEARIFVVNGVVFDAVVTTPKQTKVLGEMDIQEAMLFTPLSQLRQVSVVFRKIRCNSNL